jgi:hypothetical protein
MCERGVLYVKRCRCKAFPATPPGSQPSRFATVGFEPLRYALCSMRFAIFW